jgi:hypothetical protein
MPIRPVAAPSIAKAHGSHAVPFTDGGSGNPITLGGIKATQLHLNPTLANSLKALDAADGHLFAGAFNASPQDLACVLGDQTKLKNFAFDAMVGAGDDFMGSYGSFDPVNHRMSVTPLKPGEAARTLAGIANHYIPANEQAKNFQGQIKTLSDSMLHDPATTFLKASWDNQDDTDAQAIIAINNKTGQVRLFVGNNQP